MHPQQRLAGGAERLGQEELGHHHALEQVGGLADDDRVDLVEGQAGVLERAVHRLAAQAGHRDVLALGAVVGLADADDGGGLLAHRASSRRLSSSMVHTRFCWRAGPDVACASVRRRLARPDPAWRPRRRGCRRRRTSGCSASAPPDGLIADVVAQPELAAQDQLLVAERRVQLGHLDAVDAEPAARPPRPTASGSGRGSPMLIGSTTCASPVIQAGRSADVAGPVAGGEHDARPRRR